MKYTNILVPYDGSSHAKNALEAALDFVESNPETRVNVVSVVNVAVNVANIDTDAKLNNLEPSLIDYQNFSHLFSKQQQAVHEKMESVAASVFQGIEPERIIVNTIMHSSVIDGIERYYYEHGCDLIVMGRRGLGGIRGLVGSVSKGILRDMEAPVFTVM